jgi:hypothetical protein
MAGSPQTGAAGMTAVAAEPAREARDRADRRAPRPGAFRPGLFFVRGGAGSWHAVASAHVHMGFRDGAAAPVAGGPALCGEPGPGPWPDLGGRPFGPLCRGCAAVLRRGRAPRRAPRRRSIPVSVVRARSTESLTDGRKERVKRP